MTEVRRLFHRVEGVQPLGLDEALADDGHAEFYDGPVEASHLAFTLLRVGLGILVRNDEDRHLATFADPAQAIVHGFAHVDRPRRARRRTRKTGAR